ncbi:aminotransferase class V-fold PLP-dependent enzyme [Nocardia cyriacigeorgica]|uniref:Aminotransferase class V-fold PLP-dependent enzyme n=1 Tax=Nocardia cyriacigeorgica TaxID=135487 RepID=A0A6P1D2I9_9NOCA|nr:aminotransferase class V-fold PLP-dependent enzyme [Nocardia cyriacigeorgica]NEW44756.1 aminotransferase class V-fold PLP-dependent enzyme [Nocardia cyriacigeorgica]
MSGDVARTVSAQDFLADYPEYATTTALDDLRATEYAYLDRNRDVYLDYTGAGLAATTQHQAHHEWISAGCRGNPHSDNPTSRAATAGVETARASVLAHFNAPAQDYTVIFTANATAACRLVGEAYPFGRATRFVLTADNHNSVNGIREFARSRRARTEYIPIAGSELRVAGSAVRAALERRTVRETLSMAVASGREGSRGLFAYPAQSNFTGVQHPLDWVDIAHEHGFDVLLDAAAYLPTHELDLAAVRADFVPVSWYKLFGYPTGVGCLIARRDALSRLRRPWFSGGTIQTASVQGGWHAPAAGPAEFEDGTVNFLAIPDIEHGLSWLRGVGVDVINRRTRCLTGWLLDRLLSLQHDNGASMVRIYGPRDMVNRGATVALNILDPFGAIVDERLVAQESSAAGYSLRTGCFCNPGAGEAAFDIGRPSLLRQFRKSALSVDAYITELGLPTGGALRVSFGIASTFQDVQRFVEFVETTYRNRSCETQGLPPRENC